MDPLLCIDIEDQYQKDLCNYFIHQKDNELIDCDLILDEKLHKSCKSA